MATDPLSLLFIGCFLFGLLFLLATALLGNLGHGHGGMGGTHHVHVHVEPTVGHAHGLHSPSAAHTVKGVDTPANTHNFSLFSYINPTSLVLFLLGFGFFGYVFHTVTSFILPLTLVLAAVAGCIVAVALLALISQVFGDSEGATVQDVADRTGLLGKVSITIPENGLGEVLYVSPGGMRKSIPARSSDGRRLERGQEVVVINYQSGVAEVDTWEHFVSQEEAGAAEPHQKSNVDELAQLRALLEESQGNDSALVLRKDMQKEN